MRNFISKVTVLIMLIQFQFSFSQSPCYPESIISYDIVKQSFNDKSTIPFDRAFTLSIDKVLTKNVVAVHVYETEFKNGEKFYVFNKYLDCDGKQKETAIMDLNLKFNPLSETLQICFPALKPNSTFAVHIITKLAPECLEKLMELNTSLNASNAGTDEFKKFESCTVDKYPPRYMGLNLVNYKSFFDNNLKTSYANISNQGNFRISSTLTQIQLNALDSVTTHHVSEFRDGGNLQEVFKRSLMPDILLGKRDIYKVFNFDKDSIADMGSPEKRIANLLSNLKFIDDGVKKITRVLSKGINKVTITTQEVDLNTLKKNLETIRNELRFNLEYIKQQMKPVDKAIAESEELKQVVLVSGNTNIVDLKTEGGNILFLDAGFANIFAKDLKNKTIYIPKLYLGVSIYFRPIDKNTRREKFDSKLNPNEGCIVNRKTSANEYGPDYGIASRWSIWQRLSLNIGVTLGSMANKEFDNFYNSNSLLIGPAYRFKRAFKISAGVAFLKRTSKNPLISEKEIIPAFYGSLSVDIDFVSTVSEVKSILFK